MVPVTIGDPGGDGGPFRFVCVLEAEQQGVSENGHAVRRRVALGGDDLKVAARPVAPKPYFHRERPPSGEVRRVRDAHLTAIGNVQGISKSANYPSNVGGGSQQLAGSPVANFVAIAFVEGQQKNGVFAAHVVKAHFEVVCISVDIAGDILDANFEAIEAFLKRHVRDPVRVVIAQGYGSGSIYRHGCDG